MGGYGRTLFLIFHSAAILQLAANVLGRVCNGVESREYVTGARWLRVEISWRGGRRGARWVGEEGRQACWNRD